MSKADDLTTAGSTWDNRKRARLAEFEYLTNRLERLLRDHDRDLAAEPVIEERFYLHPWQRARPTRAGTGTGVAAYDILDLDAVADAHLDLGARVTAVEMAQATGGGRQPGKVYVVVHRPDHGRSAGPLAVLATSEEAERAIAELDDTGGFSAAYLDVEGWTVGEILRPGPEAE